MARPPVALTIAGSDSSGSSGIQADLPTFAALGVHALTVVTVVTAQSTLGVSAFHQLPPEVVGAQLEAVVDDLAPAATKTGMVRDVALLDTLVVAASVGRLGRLVVDPVLVDSAGAVIVDPAAVDAYRRLVAVADVATPNRWEAELLLGRPLADTAAVVAAAEELRSIGSCLWVITGGRRDGHAPMGEAGPSRGGLGQSVDVVVHGSGVDTVDHPRVGDRPVRGTGCTFSAAVAALLARGETPEAAASGAGTYVAAQLAIGITALGRGRPGIVHTAPPLEE